MSNQRGNLLLYLLIAMVLIVLLIMGGIVWTSYQSSVNRSVNPEMTQQSGGTEIISEPGMQPQEINVEMDEADFQSLDADLNQL